MTDLLIKNATIITTDRDNPRAESMRIHENRIVAVGDMPAVRRSAHDSHAPATEIDLGGRTVVPGFNDAHLHLVQLGAQERQIDLRGLSKSEIVERLGEHEPSLPAGEPLIGNKWDYPSCPDPHKRDLDAAFPERPVFLIQFSGHGAWLNSAALAHVGITSDTPDWGMGGADRDESGELTGIIREPGQHPKIRKIWFRSLRDRGEIRENLRAAMPLLASHGITSVQDNTWFPWVLSELQKLHARGEQTVRVSCWSMGTVPPLEWWFRRKRFKVDWYAKGPRKFFLDGAFSSHSAWLLEPYADRPESVGSGMEAEKIARFLGRSTRRRTQIACHAIGDAATKAYLDAAEMVDGGERIAELRHRIEHGQLIRDEDVARIARLGMVVAAQPHAAADPAKDERLIGRERAARAYPYRALLDAGAHLAFSSDYPGENTFDPLYGIHLAVNRPADQALTAEEAIAAYTTGAAYAEFAEERKGRIAPGYLADLAILAEDPTTVDPESIKTIRVDATMVDGRFVYEREGIDSALLERSRRTARRQARNRAH